LIHFYKRHADWEIIMEMEGVRWLLVVFLSLVLFSGAGLGCGITTHTEIGHRALEQFRNFRDETGRHQILVDILERNQDAFQAGHPFPDAFYNSLCYDGRYHAQSEDTHWGEFLQTSFDYITGRQPEWTEETEKLIAFLFGIISHQVADISWHSLKGLQNGFIPALAAVNFRGSYGDAHDHADVASDMIGVYEWDVTEYATEWYIPTHLLLNIYQDYYGAGNEMTEDLIHTCGGMLLAGRLGEQVIGKVLYPDLAAKAPAMLHDYRDYYLGGLDDMAMWTAIIWREAVTALFNGTETCSIPVNTMGFHCGEAGRADWARLPKINLHHEPHPLINNHVRSTNLTDIEMVRTNWGSRFYPSSSYQEPKELERQEMMEPEDKEFKPVMIYSEDQYSGFGKAVVSGDLNGDGVADLVVGAPGMLNRGCIYIFMGVGALDTQEELIAAEFADNVVCAPVNQEREVIGRFGSTLAILDFDGDNLLDIVVGDPYYGADELQYGGRVVQYFGTLQNNTYTLSEGAIIESSEGPAGFGATLFVGDINQDGEEELLVSSPFLGAGGIHRGAVHIYSSNLSEVGVLTGDRDYGRFGWSLDSNQDFLAVSSPYYRVCGEADCSYSEADTQSAGAVSIYRLTNIHSSGMPTLANTIFGTREFGELGASLTFTNLSFHARVENLLVVGEPVADSREGTTQQAGRVNLYTISTDGSEAEEVASLSGDVEIGRFGGQLHPLPHQGLVISAPYYGNPVNTYGKVFVYDETVDFPAGDITTHCDLSSVPCPGHLATQVLAQPEEPSQLFGAAVTSLQTGTGVRLVVGAERSSHGARLAGAVYMYPSPPVV